MTTILLALVVSSHADPLVDGDGAVRLTGGAGISEVGGSGRIGIEGEHWVQPNVGVGLRAAGGIDGFNTGRTLILVEPTASFRAGSNDLAVVVVPGIGLAWRTAYATAPDVQQSDDGGYSAGLDTETETQPLAMSASVFAGLQGRMSFISVAIGPRIETFAFNSYAATMNLSLGAGWGSDGE